MAGADALWGLATDLRAAGPAVVGEASQVVRRSALAMQNHARSLAPVDTGFHRSAIQMSMVGPTSAVIHAHADYAIFLEFGTSRMPPQPAMGPAFDAVAPQFVDAMAQLGERFL